MGLFFVKKFSKNRTFGLLQNLEISSKIFGVVVETLSNDSNRLKLRLTFFLNLKYRFQCYGGKQLASQNTHPYYWETTLDN